MGRSIAGSYGALKSSIPVLSSMLFGDVCSLFVGGSFSFIYLLGVIVMLRVLCRVSSACSDGVGLITSCNKLSHAIN